MRLPALIEILDRTQAYKDLAGSLRQAGQTTATIPDAAKPLVLASIWLELRRPILVVTAKPEAARRLHDQITSYHGDDPNVLLLPEPDALPYERLVSERSTVHQRLGALAAMAARSPLVIASVYAVAAKTLVAARYLEATHAISRGEHVEPMALLRRWTAMGYDVAQAVEIPGQVSQRGGIVDIYPPTSAKPVRIDLFGDVVDSIRQFDPATQRSLDHVPRVVITPATEVLLTSGLSLTSFDLASLKFEARERFEGDLRKLADGVGFEEIELYRGLVNTATAFDYLPDDGLLVIDESGRITHTLDELEAQAVELRDRLISEGELPKGLPMPCLAPDELHARVEKTSRRLTLNAFAGGDASFPFATNPSYAGQTRVLLEDVDVMRAQEQRIVIVSQQAPRLAELFRERNIPVEVVTDLIALPPPRGVAMVHGALAEGWSLPGERLVLLTDAEIFGITKQRRYLRKRPVQRQSFMAELSVGDYVVHVDYGVGRFAGTTTRQDGERQREYLVLEYAGSDRLLVPTDQIDRVGPYVGASGKTPSLTRLGTHEWERTKARVKASTAHMARELLAIYASREVVHGHPFGADTPWQAEVEASFPYVETPDQLRAINDVKHDMESPKPMDRVITGDVCYGKTEVALRAAFKAVMEGKQVAILVPTTVLAQQHFNTFTERLAPFPVKVEMLSRFRSPQQQDAVVEALTAGGVDICIGTHRLLQKDVQFKDLGLVVIDEEQRFGVAHKERFKAMRQEVDVLSMSATPIPRTLYMALAGVRDMSVMETPPEERLPIKTYVAEFDETLVREAIVRELERGGQVFFVHNRVYNIGAIAERVRHLVPEARVLVGHGQLPEDQLEDVMVRFSRGDADVLVSTTIIESGLDMPNVNTLIVNDADRMGLSQLYQLRGRVGRGPTRAYAYFFYKPERQITETADKRLKTILSATELGAGFRIAMKDLEIRGAGNLLGSEQHGHISAVGFDLYVRLLAEAVAELKESPEKRAEAVVAALQKQPQPVIDLPMAAHVPESYIPDLATRLGVYKRMAALTDPTQVDDLADELRDRFGDWPEPVENLLFMLKVKLLATKAGVLSISEQTGDLVLTGDDRTWSGLLGVQRPYGDGVRIGNTRVRLDIRRLGNKWRQVLEKMLVQVAEKDKKPVLAAR
ncbi:MAG: transcription-repair coupling factor [Chloroflexi bacterium]|nr:transcription-repair coupling factor [Chloroflexota bacterium]